MTVILPEPFKKVSPGWCLTFNYDHNWKRIKGGKECRDCAIKVMRD